MITFLRDQFTRNGSPVSRQAGIRHGSIFLFPGNYNSPFSNDFLLFRNIFFEKSKFRIPTAQKNPFSAEEKGNGGSLALLANAGALIRQSA
jgi:hypothetical protein